MLKVISYSDSLNAFTTQKEMLLKAGFSSDQIVFGDSKNNSREDLINSYQGRWLLFLDHDCSVTAQTKKFIDNLVVGKDSRPVLYAGIYKDPEDSTVVQRAHNLIANTWLAQSYLSKEPMLLGGAFLIFVAQPVALPLKKFWGGEDKMLAKSLSLAGYKLNLLEDLVIIHDTSKNFSHFVKRAYLHGKNDVLYFEKIARLRLLIGFVKLIFQI